MADKGKSTAVDIIATVRDNMREDYAKRIPDPTKDGIAAVGKAFSSDIIAMNEFVREFMNKIVLQMTANKANFESPFRQFYGQNMPLGANIEERYTNPAEDTGYQGDGALLLKTTTPDSKIVYYGLNRRGRYTVTKREFEIQKAFMSEGAFTAFLNEIVNTLYSGDSIDEYLLGKQLIGTAIDNNVMQVVKSDIDNPKEIAKSIANLSKYMIFPTTYFCGYNRANNLSNVPAEGQEKPCITWCPKRDQMLIIRADVETEMDFEYLAMLYNMSIAEINMKKVVVDDIPTKTGDIHAILCDKASIRINDTINRMKEFDNGSNLDHTYFYHHHQAYNWSMFGNCIALGDMDGAVGASEALEAAAKSVVRKATLSK